MWSGSLRSTRPLLGFLALLSACAGPLPTTDTPELLAAARGADRPLGGACVLVLAPRVHDHPDEGGGCSGGHESEPEDGHDSGTPPIARHYDLSGTCQLTHLGRTTLSGRLNLTGPLGGGHGGAGGTGQGGILAARGRLLLVAANGDQLAGRLVPESAEFTRDPGGDGGLLRFTVTQQFGESCEGGGAGGGGHEGEETHEEPVSTGRFAGASGWATLGGTARIWQSTGAGRGDLMVAAGRISY